MRERLFVALLSLGILGLLPACGPPSLLDASTADGKRAIIERANAYLSKGECSEAIALIQPVYDSVNTDNEVRMLTASAYACNAGVNFFNLVWEIATNGAALAGNPWALMVKLFPSTLDPDDRVMESSLLSTDALMSQLKVGAVILPSQYINGTSHNPGSAVLGDRIDDANTYLMFVSMGAIGSILNRYGSPDADHKPATATILPWRDANHADMPTQGCALAASVLNYYDSLQIVQDLGSENFSNALRGVVTLLGGGLDAACSLGCTACGLSCSACPTTLRNRDSCTGLATDENSCAAAFLVRSINTLWSAGLAVP